MERVTELTRKLIGADEHSIGPPPDGGDPASYKHLWAMLAISVGIIIFGIVMAFSGLFEL